MDIDTQETPEASSDTLKESTDPQGAANSVALETEKYADRADQTVMEHASAEGFAGMPNI